MYRKLASVILVASAINAKYVYALGLGEMTMHSALNEPLSAEIQLKNVGDLDSTQIIVKLAEDAQFNNAGIERTFFLSNIRFSVQINSEGNGVVKLKSQKRVNEPFLDFLVEAKWPTGKVLRSYTALVDLPVYSDVAVSTVDMGVAAPTQAAPAIAEPRIETEVSMSVQSIDESKVSVKNAVAVEEPKAQAEPEVLPIEKPAQVDIAVPSAPKTSNYSYHQEVESNSQYGTQRGDTLWAIAAEYKPASELSVQQVMIAIQRENPKAFIGGNINRLKAGMILNLPSATQIYDITNRDAVSEVGRQNQELSYAPQIDATQESAAVEVHEVSAEKGHLSLSASGTGAGVGSEEAGSMSASEEGVMASENASLNKQVGSLSTQVDQLERLLEIKEQQLAEFQNNLSDMAAASATETLEVASGEVVEATDVVEVSATGEEPELVSEDVIESEAVADIVEEVSEEPVEVVVPSKSIVDVLFETPMYLGGIALLIMAIVAGLFIRKRNQSEQAIIDSLEEFDFDEEAIEPELEQEIIEEAPLEEESDVVEELVEEVTEEVIEKTAAQTGDAVGEADIYIAYGRFDQASELLQGALKQLPEDVALRSKLLEVYAQSGNQEGFVAEFNKLEAQGEVEAINSAKELLSTIDGGSSWLSSVPQSNVSQADQQVPDISLDDFSLDSALDDSLSDDNSSLDVSLDAELDDLDLGGSLDDALNADEQPLDDLDLDLELDDSGDDASVLDDLDLDLSGAAEEEVSLETSSLDDTALDASVLDEVLETLDDAVDDLGLGDLDLEVSDLPVDSDISLDAELLDLDLGEALELDADDDLGGLDLSADLEDVSLDDVDLDLSVDPEVEVIAAPFEEEDVLDLGDIDLGIGESAELATDDVDTEILDLNLGDELDLSADVSTEPELEVAEEVASVDDAELSSLDDDLSFLTDEDEISTKLDLARAYVEMGDADGAKDILDEVVEEGNDAQKSEAESMLSEIA